MSEYPGNSPNVASKSVQQTMEHCTLIKFVYVFVHDVYRYAVRYKDFHAPVMDFIRSEDVAFSIRPHSSAHSGDSHNAIHCQVGIASGRSHGGDWRRRPGRPRARWTGQRHWICPCQPLETGHSRWWSDTTARAGYVMTLTKLKFNYL